MFIPDIVFNSGFYLASILVFNNTLIIAVLTVALYKIKKLLNEVPQVA